MLGVEAWRYICDEGVAMRASWGEPIDCGVEVALWTALAPLARWETPGEGRRWWTRCSWGDEVICWLRPEGVREGIWRTPRLGGDWRTAGEGCCEGWCEGGGGVLVGVSEGDSSELMSMAAEERLGSRAGAVTVRPRRAGDGRHTGWPREGARSRGRGDGVGEW
jgi:hypothetical protein